MGFSLKVMAPMVILFGWSKLGIDASPGSQAEMYIRIACFSVAFVCLLCMAIICMKVNATDNQTPVVIETPKTTTEEAKTKTVTTTKHDWCQVMSLIPKIMEPIGLVMMMHLKWEVMMPMSMQTVVLLMLEIQAVMMMPMLVMQTVMMLMSMMGSKLFKVYILGTEAPGNLERPWPPLTD